MTVCGSGELRDWPRPESYDPALSECSVSSLCKTKLLEMHENVHYSFQKQPNASQLIQALIINLYLYELT